MPYAQKLTQSPIPRIMAYLFIPVIMYIVPTMGPLEVGTLAALLLPANIRQLQNQQDNRQPDTLDKYTKRMNDLLKWYVVLHLLVNMRYFPHLICCQEVQNKRQDPIAKALFLSEQMCFSEFVILEVQTSLLNLFKTEAARLAEQDDSKNNEAPRLT